MVRRDRNDYVTVFEEYAVIYQLFYKILYLSFLASQVYNK